MMGTVYSMYFSPTHGSQKIARAIGEVLTEKLDKNLIEINLTLPEERDVVRQFTADDILIFGFPVYAGRIPALLEETLSKISGENTPAVLAATYGNRDYDDALLEASDLLAGRGFIITAGGAFIGEHSLSRKLAAGRPDESDLKCAKEFALDIVKKLAEGVKKNVEMKGSRPYKERGPGMPTAPKTNEKCTDCMICAQGCPVGVISMEDPRIATDGCIYCFACVKFCPEGAKYFDDERLLKMAAMLETNFKDRKEPELFL